MLCLVLTVLNWGFVMRGGALAMAALGLVAAVSTYLIGRAFPPVPYAQPPPPPTIQAPRGEIPASAAGLQLWVRPNGEEERLAGSAFLLLLPDGQIVGLTAAHHLGRGD